MLQTLDVVQTFLARVENEVERQAENCGGAKKQRLQEMLKTLKKVPFAPAENFQEAVQAVWIIHFLLPLAENAWYSISLGKFDEYMLPFYRKSVDEGMTKDEAKEILRNFYELLNGYADGACLLNIGPVYNELSELIAECQKEFALPAPILAARIDGDVPQRIWEKLIDEKLFSMGQPTFYGENSCKKALIEKGLSAKEAENFSNNSCMGIAIPGSEFNSMWGCVTEIPLMLEASLNGGKLLRGGERIPNVCEPKNTEEVFKNFETCAKYILDLCVKSYEIKAEASAKNEPDCFLSLLTKDCILKRCDRIYGAKYHNVTVECFGTVNASDGIYAVDKLVFTEKKYDLKTVIEAVKNNFKGYETLREDMMNCPKFGENSAADEYAVRVAEILQRLIRAHSKGNVYYSPSLHTLDSNAYHGSILGASFDGRYAGTPLAKNAGATNEARRADPTAMILSASKLPQYKFFGGQPIDVNFRADAVKNHKDAIQALIKVYFERGGIQFQVNSLSSKLLREATDHPEKYPHLIVRIGGYSLYFNGITRESKEEIVARFEKEGY